MAVDRIRQALLALCLEHFFLDIRENPDSSDLDSSGTRDVREARIVRYQADWPRCLWRDRHRSIERLRHELRWTITESLLDKISIHSGLERPDHISPTRRHGKAKWITIRGCHGLPRCLHTEWRWEYQSSTAVSDERTNSMVWI